MCDECNRSNEIIVCHKALVHLVIDRAILVTDHRKSGRPTRAKYKHFTKISEQTVDNSPTVSCASSSS